MLSVPSMKNGDDARRAILAVREAMEKRGLTQRDVAGIIGNHWSQGRVQKLLTHQVELRVDDLAALCFAVGISLSEAVRDRGLEFYAEMTPTELRLFERIRDLTPDQRSALMTILNVKPGPEARRSKKRKP